MNKKQNRRKGISLIEVLLSLVILAIIVGAAMNIYEKAHIENKVVDARKEYFVIRSIVKTLYDGNFKNSDWSRLSQKTIIDSGMLPKQWVRDSTIVNPFGGIVVIYYNVDKYYQTVFYSVPKSACVLLASTHDWTAGAALQINSYQDNNSSKLSMDTITKNACHKGSNMFAWATSIQNL